MSIRRPVAALPGFRAASGARLRSRVLPILVAAGTLIPLAAFVPTASAGEGDGTLTVQVVRDADGNGTYESRTEPGVAGIGVQVSDGLGGVSTGVTGTDGTVPIDLDPLAGGRYRVQTSIPPELPYLQQTLVSLGSTPDRLAPATSFVDVSDGAEVTHTVGVWDPADFVDADARYITTQQPRTWNGLPSLEPALVTFPLGQRGTDGAGLTTEATWSEIGSTYGLAYDRTGRNVYIGALAKRHSGYGPGGGGAIYEFDVDSGSLNVFATVPDAAPTAHRDIEMDTPFADVSGKESLGDVELSPDGQSVLTVALASKGLYRFPLDGGEPEVTPIPAPEGISDPDDWRPFALGVANGKLYVGGVQSAQTSNNLDDLKVTVYQVDGTDFVPVLDGTLGGVQRGYAAGGGPLDLRNHWHPWTNDPRGAEGSGTSLIIYPQPLLTDIEFDNAGSMLLGFRDRTSDQVGYRDGDGAYTYHVSGGDLVKACGPVDGPWTVEYESDSPLCVSNTTSEVATDGGQDPAVREFYIGDFIGTYHQETGLGGLRVNKSAGDVASTTMDPAGRVNVNGIGWYDQLTGEGPGTAPEEERGLILTHDYNTSFGKGNGLGDLELIVAQAPVQIGDRVWFDTDRDGAQDANEPPIGGATVELVAENGTVVATTTTDENGDYYFNESDGLEPGTSYQVRFDWSTGTIFGEPIPQGSAYTSPLAEGDSPEGSTTVDSNAVVTDEDPAVGLTSVEPLVPGEVNHDYDAGINPPVPGYEFGKTADPGQGGVVVPGSPIRYTLTGTNTGQTVLDPVVISDDLSAVLDDAELSGPITLRVLGSDGGEVSSRPVALNTDADGDGTPDGFTVDDVVLQVGGRAVVTYEVRVRQGTSGDGAISNGATSTAQPPSPVPPGPCCQVPPPDPIGTDMVSVSQTVEHAAPPAKPAEPAPAPPEKKPAPPAKPAPAEPEPDLAATGAQIAAPAALALLLVGAGAVTVALARRRPNR